MSEDNFSERIKESEKVFEGLLSLIPAKLYYEDEDAVEGQWSKKKQTKAEAKAARKAKLDPANAKSAKDLLNENSNKKRKRDEDGSDPESITKEAPREGLKKKTKQAKDEEKDGKVEGEVGGEVDSEKAREIREKRAAKRERKRAKKEELKTKAEKKKAEKQAKKLEVNIEDGEKVDGEAKVGILKKQAKESSKDQQKKQSKEVSKDQPVGQKSKKQTKEMPTLPEKRATSSDEEQEEDEEDQPEEEDDDESEDEEFNAVDVNLDGDSQSDKSSSTAGLSSPDRSVAFDISNPESGTSSISSVTEPLTATPAEKPSPKLKIPSSEAKARLQKRIEELRAARKAINEDGTPARTRQELIESRRRREQQRKAHKKQLRQQAKEDERRKREEDLSHGSPLLSPAIMSPRGSHGGSPSENGFAFGRIALGNGQLMNATLDNVIDTTHKKGPSDVKTALEAASKREARVAGFDVNKKADIAEKDMWLNARKRAQGERIRDDTSLLKKTLKRKEKQKKKSEKDWTERIEGVQKSQFAKQQKREDNLRKRKEEKGSKGKKNNKGIKSKGKARPGFEGSFRAGGKKK